MTFDQKEPGYRGTMTHNGVTIAEALKENGYQTAWVGKWHVAETPLRPDQRKWLAHQVQHEEFAPKNNYPINRGFQDCYGTIYGVVDYFDPFSLISGDKPVHTVPKDYYSTIALADTAVAYINKYAQSDSPFFMYLAFHSPHWPLHALPEDIEKYKDTYTEGPWFYKRNGKYYLLYAAGGVPEHIAYSMGDSPEGPWKYMGEIMPLQDTGSFTNHCGVADYKGNSYFFYHTGKLPGGGGFGRSVAIEEFKYNPDGTFPIINATKEGVKPVSTFNPYRRVEAETIAYSEGVKSEPNAKTGLYISEIHNGDYIKVREVDFGKKGPKSFRITAASALRGGTIEVRTDSIAGNKIAEVNIPTTGGWEEWKTFNSEVKTAVTGVHDVYFVFRGRKGCKLFNLDWWEFSK